MRFATSLIFLALASLGSACDSGAVVAANEDLTAAGKKLIGAYVATDAGPIRGLVLTSATANASANRFFADIDVDGAEERVEGTFTGGTKTLTLKSDAASFAAKQALGKYSYTFDGETLSLTRSGRSASLEKV